MKQLGHYNIPDSFKHDLEVQERYQSFSKEILRLSLLGIGAIGFLISKVFLSKDFNSEALDDFTKYFIIIALIAFGIASVAALIHRYAVVDMLSWQMQTLRRDERTKDLTDPQKKAAQLAQAKKEATIRFSRWKISKKALIAAALCIAIGGICLAIALAIIVFNHL